MATVQVRDVPDEVAAVIAEKARAEHKSVSAYLRDLMAADVRRELQRRAIATWDEELKQTQQRLGITLRGCLVYRAGPAPLLPTDDPG